MALLRRLGREHDAVATVKDRTLILAAIGAGTAAGGTALPRLALTRADLADYRYSEVERDAAAGVEAVWHDKDAGERKRVSAGSGAGGGQGGKPRRLRRVYHSEEEARAAARAAAGRAVRAEATMDVTLALGRPEILPEQPAALSGFKPQIDARRWIVAEATHTLDGRGLSTRLQLETAG